MTNKLPLRKKHRRIRIEFLAAVVVFIAGVLYKPVLTEIGRLLILTDPPKPADAVVVLNTGVEIYPRLMEAAALYRKGLVHRVVINGDRKSPALKRLEHSGFRHPFPWYADEAALLSFLGIPSRDILPISAPDAYDTISEADAVGSALLQRNIHRIILTTSKYHSRRAAHIWRARFGRRMSISMVAAPADPFRPDAWWHRGRQIRWVMAEYGAWIYYAWKSLL